MTKLEELKSAIDGLIDHATEEDCGVCAAYIGRIREAFPTPAASGAAPAEVQRRAVDGIREFYLGLLSSYLTTDQILRVRSDAVTRIAVECNRDVFAALASREASPATLTDERIAELWIEHGLDEDEPEGFARIIEREVRAALASPQVAPAPEHAPNCSTLYHARAKCDCSLAAPVQVAPQDDARDAALWREHASKLDALVTYCPTCCQGSSASKEMTRDEIIFECGKTVGRSAPAAKPTEPTLPTQGDAK